MRPSVGPPVPSTCVYVDLLHALNGPSGSEQVTGVFTKAEIQQKMAACDCRDWVCATR